MLFLKNLGLKLVLKSKIRIFSNHDFKKLLILLFIILVTHTFLIASINLGDDEAYYWVWSKYLALSYYDHPPMVAYVVKLSSLIFGNSPFGVRFLNIVIQLILTVLIHKTAILLFNNDTKKALNAALLINILPIFFLGANLISPDIVMVLFYVASLYIFATIILCNQDGLYKHYWYYLGLIVGLGLCAKYMMVFVYLAIFLYLLFDKKSRKILLSKEPYLAFILSLIVFMPVIYWNYQHDWASFIFQFYSRHHSNYSQTHHFGLNSIKWLNFVGFVGAQVIFISPVFFVLFIRMIATYKLRNIEYNSKNLLLFLFAVPALLIFTILALFFDTKPNWAIIAYPSLILLFVNNPKYEQQQKYNKIGIISSLVMIVIIILQVYCFIIQVKPLKNDTTNDLYGWDQVAFELKNIINNTNHISSNKQTSLDAKMPNDYFIFSYNYQLTSQLFYALNIRGDIKYPVYSITNHLEQYHYIQNINNLFNKTGFFVMTDFYHIEPENWYLCNKLQLIKTLDITRPTLFNKKLVVRHAYIYRCDKFAGLKPAK